MSLLFYHFTAAGQNKPSAQVLPVTVFNVEDGLSQSTVYQVTQDSRGLIWVATGGGLQYYDGNEFRTFDLPDDISRQISGNSIYGINETEPGRFIVSTSLLLLNFNSSTGTYHVGDRKLRSYSILFKLTINGKSLCWSSSEGLCLVDTENILPVKLRFTNEEDIPPGMMPVTAVRTRDQTIFIAFPTGLLAIKEKPSVKEMVMEAKWVPSTRHINDLCVNNQGEAFLLSDGVVLSVGQDGLQQEVINTGIREGSCLYIDRGDNMWISDITHKKLYRFIDHEPEEIRFITFEGKHKDTTDAAIRSFFEDKAGNIWFGSDGNGLLFHSPQQIRFDLAGIGFTRCMTRYKDEIWAGTYKNGLWRLTPGLGEKARINRAVLTNELYFFDLYRDPSGRVWSATNKGLYILDGKGSVLFHYPMNTSSGNFLVLPGDRVFLSTYEDLYSCEIKGKPGLKFIRKQTQVKQAIQHKGYYYICNHFGLFRRDTLSGLLSAFSFKETDQLTRQPVYSILPVDSMIWAATEHGIGLFSSSGAMEGIPKYLGELKNEVIYSLIPDHQGRIWFSGNKGVGCIPASRDRIIRFSRKNNLQSSEFNFNADLSTDGERIFFGGIYGINGINTLDLKIKERSPDIRLISLLISDTSFSGGIPWQEEISISLNRRDPHFSGKVFTPEYFPAGTGEYSFLLEGYQADWSTPSANPAFSYRNLPHGTYTLWARCIDPYKNQGKAKRLITIIIRPPFWKTWWFIVSASLLIIIITWLINRKIQELHYHSRLKEMEHRHAIDRERLRISQDMHDEIGSSLTQVAILSEVMKKRTDQPEEMTKLIDKISGIAGSLVDEMSDIIWAMNPKNDTLASFTSYVRQHVSEYLVSAGITAEFSIPGDPPEVPMTSEQRRNLFLVIKESVHNVVKHAGAAKVRISIGCAGNELEIVIEDNGKGFEKEHSSLSGNGLINMQKRMELLGGTLFLDPVPGRGTRITFSVFL